MNKLFFTTKIVSLLFLTFSLSYSQSSIKDSAIGITIASIDYSFQIPGGDLKDRFGNNSSLGGGFAYKFKSNWEIGVEYHFLFGNDVKETSMLSELETNGGILNENGEFANYQIFQRGHHIQLKGGKTFSFLSPNANSGFYIKGGIGLLTHKILFQNINGDIPQFNLNDREYRPGYDRYTSGISLSEEIGYRYLSNNYLVNFFIGIEFIQGFTKIRRDYQVDFPANFTKKNRNDFLYGLKAGWILPIYKKPSRDFYY